ncbi:MAG: hypothetical protein IKP51_11010 [Treponema sp.]|nr:hypothetical protein [Treponema sp.]
MKNKIRVFFTAALVLALASCSSMKQIFDLKGIIVSSNGQVFTGKTTTVPMDVKTGNLRYSFNATSDPVDNGYPVTIKISDPTVVSVTQSASEPSSYTITGLKSGYTDVTASCSIYTFTFTVYVADTSRGITVDKLKAQREADVARAAAAAAGISFSAKEYREDLGFEQYYAIQFTNDNECVRITRLEPPYEYRPGTYTINPTTKKVTVTYTGKVFFDEKLTKEYKDGAVASYSEDYAFSNDLSVLTGETLDATHKREFELIK